MTLIADTGNGVKLFKVDRHLKAMVGDVVVAESDDVIRLEEGRLPPVYYVPKRDVHANLLTPTDHSTHCGVKGDANYYTLRLEDGREFANAVWQYSDPKAGLEEIADRVAFYGHVVDRWVEEDAAA